MSLSYIGADQKMHFPSNLSGIYHSKTTFMLLFWYSQYGQNSTYFSSGTHDYNFALVSKEIVARAEKLFKCKNDLKSTRQCPNEIFRKKYQNIPMMIFHYGTLLSIIEIVSNILFDKNSRPYLILMFMYSIYAISYNNDLQIHYILAVNKR